VQGVAVPAAVPGLAAVAAWVPAPVLQEQELALLGLAAVLPAGVVVAVVAVAGGSRPTHRGCGRCAQDG
jgi:hypothetical protein